MPRMFGNLELVDTKPGPPVACDNDWKINKLNIEIMKWIFFFGASLSVSYDVADEKETVA